MVDIGRTGMVRGVTEQTEFVVSLSGVHLGDLGGIHARSSTFMRPLTERQRNAQDAMRLLLGRPACDHSSVADTAFDNGASAARVNLEEELEKVMDDGASKSIKSIGTNKETVQNTQDVFLWILSCFLVYFEPFPCLF